MKTRDFDFTLKLYLLVAPCIWSLAPAWILIWKSFPKEAEDEKNLFYNPIYSEFFILPLNSACKLARVDLFLTSASSNIAKRNLLMISMFCLTSISPTLLIRYLFYLPDNYCLTKCVSQHNVSCYYSSLMLLFYQLLAAHCLVPKSRVTY